MTTAICIPSRNRPQLLKALIENIEATTPEPHKLYLVVEDIPSLEIGTAMGADVAFGAGTTMVAKVNYLAAVTSEPYAYFGQDDSLFQEDWLHRVLELLDYTGGCVAINDGLGHYDTAAYTRRYIQETGTIDQPGLVLHPGYHHYWSEVEAYQTAISRGKFAYSESSIIEHHPLSDQTHKLNRSLCNEDEALFVKRSVLWGGRTDHVGQPQSNIRA